MLRTLDVVRLAGLDVGPLICFDIEFPEPARALVAAGAELLVTASANMEPFGPDHERATRQRAFENGLPHLYTNGVGAIGGLQLVGGSRSVDASGAVLAEATLSFLGLGVPEPTPSWGKMINESREVWVSAPHLFVVPGLMIMLAVLAFNFLGDGLRDYLDPKLKR